MKKKNQNIQGLIQKLILNAHIIYTNGIFSIKNNKLLAKQILLVLTLTFSVIPMVRGEISTTVFLADGNTPLEIVDPNIPHVYRDIMVGTKLKIIISSDTNEYWEGGSLGIEDVNLRYGLSAIGPEISDDWSGSHLPAAGYPAKVFDVEYPAYGFDLYVGPHDRQAGDWFIIDYNAINIGDCNVGFYDYGEGYYDVPFYYLCFSQVRTRDFSNDTIVNLADFAIFASHWLAANCTDPNWCDGTDLDTDGNVDANDLMLFCEFWLERTK